MNTFQDTVEKIAHSPAKMRALSVAPHLLVKQAAKPPKSNQLLTKLFGGNQAEQLGWQKIMQKVVEGGALAGAIGTGVLAATQLEDRFLGNSDQAKATNSEIGKLNAQNQFKTTMVMNLQPMHKKVFKNVQSDEIIGNADKVMITSAFETMKRFAPNLAADENATRSFLREHAIYGTGPSYASLKNLADAEQAIAKAGGALAM